MHRPLYLYPCELDTIRCPLSHLLKMAPKNGVPWHKWPNAYRNQGASKSHWLCSSNGKPLDNPGSKATGTKLVVLSFGVLCVLVGVLKRCFLPILDAWWNRDTSFHTNKDSTLCEPFTESRSCQFFFSLSICLWQLTLFLGLSVLKMGDTLNVWRSQDPWVFSHDKQFINNAWHTCGSFCHQSFPKKTIQAGFIIAQMKMKFPEMQTGRTIHTHTPTHTHTHRVT